MKKLLFSALVLSSFIGFADNKDEKVTYRDTVAAVSDLKVFSMDAYANDAFVKAKIRVENSHEYFIVFDPNKSFFYSAGTKFPAKEKEIIIPPGGKKTRVFDVKGKNLNVQALSLILDGFMRTGNEKVVSGKEITVSPKRKETFENIEVMVLDMDYDKEKKLNLRIKVTNTGNDIVILNPGVIEVTEEGNTLNNIRKRAASTMLRKGESETIACVFKTVSDGSEKKIIWNDALLTASLLTMDPVEIVLSANEQAAKDYKPFLIPVPKKEEVVKKEEPVAMNTEKKGKDTKGKEKPKDTKKAEPKKEVVKKEEPKKEEPKKEEKRASAGIASEGEMSELHAADVDFSAAGGKYYALLIGCSNYDDPAISDLGGLPTADAEALGKVLKANYTFAEENVKILKDPTRRDIVIALDEIAKKATSEDNVLIFYAGHGHYEDDNDIGYWLPKDAEVSNSANWLYNDQLVAAMRKIKSLHTLLIADACFSGSIFKNRSISMTGASDVIKKKYQLPSRKAITSGTLKTVPNKSVFIKYLLDRLEKNKDKFYPASTLYRAIEEPVGNNSTSLPQYGVINNVGDEGGDFIFIKKK
jgi:hypothetical protein